MVQHLHVRQPAALAECYYRFANLPHYLTSTLSLMTAVNQLGGSKPRYRITAEQLVTITQPVLYLWGTNDPFGSVETGRKIASLVPHSEFHTLTDGGHLPWLDDPECAGRLVSDFLDRHQSSEAGLAPRFGGFPASRQKRGRRADGYDTPVADD